MTLRRNRQEHLVLLTWVGGGVLLGQSRLVKTQFNIGRGAVALAHRLTDYLIRAIATGSLNGSVCLNPLQVNHNICQAQGPRRQLLPLEFLPRMRQAHRISRNDTHAPDQTPTSGVIVERNQGTAQKACGSFCCGVEPTMTIALEA